MEDYEPAITIQAAQALHQSVDSVDSSQDGEAGKVKLLEDEVKVLSEKANSACTCCSHQVDA